MNNNLGNINKLYELKRYLNQIDHMVKYSELLKKCESYKGILGPSGLILYKINNKYVFLFQDVHKNPVKECNDFCESNKNQCIWIDDFFNDLFSISPFYIDFFQETIMFLQIPKKEIGLPDTSLKFNKMSKRLKKQKDQGDSGLSRVMGNFADCLGPEKQTCKNKYERVRFHNIEFRRFMRSVYDIDFDLTNIFAIPIYYVFTDFGTAKTMSIKNIKDKDKIDIKKYDNAMKLFLDNIEKYENILKYLLNGNMDMFSKTIYELFGLFTGVSINEYATLWKPYFEPDMLKAFSPYPKIHKQLSAFDTKVGKILEKYIMDKFTQKIEEEIKGIKDNKIKLDEAIKNNNDEDSMKYLRSIITRIFFITKDLSTSIFDAYTMLRLMKSILIYPDSPVIIMYAGSIHIDHYIDLFVFLEKEGVITLTKNAQIGNVNTKPNACINLDEYKKEWGDVINTSLKMLK